MARGLALRSLQPPEQPSKPTSLFILSVADLLKGLISAADSLQPCRSRFNTRSTSEALRAAIRIASIMLRTLPSRRHQIVGQHGQLANQPGDVSVLARPLRAYSLAIC